MSPKNPGHGWIAAIVLLLALAGNRECLGQRLESEGARDAFSGRTIRSQNEALDLLIARGRNAPKPGEKAPPFALRLAGEEGLMSLSQLHRDKPLVLIFGTHGCDVFQKGWGGLWELYGKYRNEYQFALVYIREAHAKDGFQPEKARHDDPKTNEARQALAVECRTELKLPFPVLVDDISDPIGTRWAAWPVRLFVIERDGTVSFAGANGPWGFRPTKAFLHQGGGNYHPTDEGYSKDSLEAFLEKRAKRP